jgi:anti-sigma factor RsiW
MDCREFQEQHVAFVDDVLSAGMMAGMQEHLDECPACAHHDIAVRRGLLVARNLPRVHCSADFMDRLHERLREPGSPAAGALAPRWWQAWQGGSFALLAASVVGVAALAAWGASAGRKPEIVRLAPVVATLPAPEPSPISAPAYMVAPLAVGLPGWSVVIAADETPMHMANMELRQVSLER